MEHQRQVETQFAKISEPVNEDTWDDEIQEESVEFKEPKSKKKKKTARRIIVTEVSDESDHDDVEVVLPKQRPPPEPTPEEQHFERTMNRMFNL